MTNENPTDNPKPSKTLRERAEELLKTPAAEIADMPPADVQKLVQELQVHQMELQIQNEELREAQTELAHSLDRYSDLYEFAPVGYLTFDQNAVIREANLTAADLLAVERGSLLGRQLSDFIARKSQDAWHGHRRAVFSGEVKRTCELAMNAEQGATKIFQLQSLAVRDKDGNLGQARCALIDATERTVAHDALGRLNIDLTQALSDRTGALDRSIEQVRLMSEAVSHLGEGVVITEDDLNWPGPNIIFANEAMCRITGYTADELIGQSPRILQGEETDGEATARIRAELSAGRSCTAQLINYRKDGTPYNAELFITPLFDSKGRRTNFVSIHRDVTEQTRARQWERTLARVLEESLNEIYLFDAETLKFTNANRGARQNLGYSLEELRAMTPVDLKPEYTSDSFGELLKPLQTGDRESLAFETVHVRKDQTTYPVEVHLQRVSGDSNPLFVAIILDITARAEAGRRLQASEERLRAILGTASDAIINIDQRGVITDVNRATGRLFGYREDELIGENVKILMPEPYHGEHDGHLSRYLETGEAHIIGTGREVRGRRKDGSTFPADLAVSEVKGLGLYTGIVRDITDRKEAEQELRNVYEFNENLIETAMSIVLVLDSEGRVVRFNPAFERLSGWKIEEAECCDWFETFLPERDRPRIRRLFGKTISGEPTRGNVNPIVTKSGEEREIEWRDAILKDPDGGFVGLLCTGTDVTERLRLEQEVVAATEEERQRIAQDLHDDLGSLLTGVDFRVQALAKTLQKREDTSGAENSRQIHELIRIAIRKTRTIAKGLHPVGTHPEDLMGALRDLVQIVKADPTSKCQFRCPEPVLIHDSIVANHLFRIAQEAVNNAAKHSGGSQITVSLKESGGEIVLRVSDNGTGFDLEEKASSGLGLHTMNYRAQSVGASLEIRRRRKGGTRVVCSVPTHPEVQTG